MTGEVSSVPTNDDRNCTDERAVCRKESVAAWGGIDGQLIADRSTDFVRSGGAVTGLLIAPDVRDPLGFDPYILNQFEFPETPESIRAAIQAEQAEAYQQILADRAELDAAFAELAESNQLLLGARDDLQRIPSTVKATSPRLFRRRFACSAVARVTCQNGFSTESMDWPLEPPTA